MLHSAIQSAHETESIGKRTQMTSSSRAPFPNPWDIATTVLLKAVLISAAALPSLAAALDGVRRQGISARPSQFSDHWADTYDPRPELALISPGSMLHPCKA